MKMFEKRKEKEMRRIKILLGILLVGWIFLFVPLQATAQAVVNQAGATLFGEGERDPNSNVIYTLPDISKRVKDPMEIRIACVLGDFEGTTRLGKDFRGVTLRKLFENRVQDPHLYVILRIEKAYTTDQPQLAAIYYFYIEKEKLIH